MDVTPNFEYDDYNPEEDRKILKSIIQDYNNDSINNCTESYFKDNFLMAFFGAKTQKEIDNVRLNWESLVAKNDRLPVRVVADNDPKNILFIVPPMIGTVPTSFSGNAQSMVSAFKRYKELNNRLFTQGQRYIRDRLDNTPYDCSINAYYRQQWLSIYTRYGLIKPEADENVTPASNVIVALPEPSDPDDEEMSFD